jgi:tetratricopeptide (TPR) repeat protein
MIGTTYVTLGNYQDAIFYLEKANSLYQKDDEVPPPYWNLAEAYFKVGRNEDALKINTKALTVDGEYPWYYMQRGIILSQNGDDEVLTENYQKAVLIDPKDISFHKEYSLRLIEMGYQNKAYDLYNTWLNENDRYHWCYAGIGYILMLEGDFVKSKDYLIEAERINNIDIPTLEYLSFYYFFTRDYEKAYEYDGSVRLETSSSDVIHWYKSTSEYIEGYKNNWQFERLLEKLN